MLLTNYPEAGRLFDYGALHLKTYRSGAVIRLPEGTEPAQKSLNACRYAALLKLRSRVVRSWFSVAPITNCKPAISRVYCPPLVLVGLVRSFRNQG